MRKPELLAPAGDWEKLKYALAYGADAVYIGGQAFGLRAYAGNFELEEMEKAVSWTHDLGKKLYVTVNIFAHEQDFEELSPYLKQLEALGVDGAIVSDPGVMAMAKKVAPRLSLHLSTQANNTNSYSIRFWIKQGIERVVLARELTIKELNDVRSKVEGWIRNFYPWGNVYVLFRAMFIKQLFNRQGCQSRGVYSALPLGYALVEEKRPGVVFPIEEDERGTYVFNSHDLCLLPHLPLLKPIDIDSYKIEGRMKSVQYVASTVKVYREAIDTLWDQGEETFRAKLPKWLEEMDKVSHRDYSAGFLFGKPGASSHNLVSSHYVRDYDFVGVELDKEEVENGASDATDESIVWIEQRNNFKLGEVLEVLTPQGDCWSFEIKRMWDIKGEPIEVARHAQQKVRMAVPRRILPYSVFRRAKSEKM